MSAAEKEAEGTEAVSSRRSRGIGGTVVGSECDNSTQASNVTTRHYQGRQEKLESPLLYVTMANEGDFPLGCRPLLVEIHGSWDDPAVPQAWRLQLTGCTSDTVAVEGTSPLHLVAEEKQLLPAHECRVDFTATNNSWSAHFNQDLRWKAEVSGAG